MKKSLKWVLEEIAQKNRHQGRVYSLLGDILTTLTKEEDPSKIISIVEEIMKELDHLWHPHSKRVQSSG